MQNRALVGRAGGKLRAAIDRFDLGPRIAGATAVDVGASTGGFTDVLLAAGAARVVAVDVGHGQLHASLRTDARVQSLEGVDWKRLSLDVAPGPFDFFTVDVSFVAARNMLRGLAFRLRPRAEGVVLLKPQFELPDRQVKAAGTDDPALRRRALDRFAARAATLGFEIAGTVDCPVAGARGTVEMLLHLRFTGRPASLPARRPVEESKNRAAAVPLPGTKGRRGGATTEEKASVATSLSWFAVAAPGLEATVERELLALPSAAEIRRVDGGVEFAGPVAVGLRANLCLRTATRVLARVGTIEAREFSRLRRSLARLPWERFVTGPVDVSASATRCRLYHTGALAEAVVHAVGDRLGTRPAAARGAQKILLRGVGDVFTASVDASGELLHRRGFRTDAADAPLRETLAAAILLLAGWDPGTPFIDPMCGTGTLPIEAALLARNLPPGLEREFAIETWPSFDAETGTRIREQLRAGARAAGSAPILGSDRDARAIEGARRNAGRAGVASDISFDVIDLLDVQPPAAARGLVAVNPPYGRRLHGGDTARAYATLGRVLRERFRGWRAAILVAEARAERAIGLRPSSSHPLVNGGLRIRLLRFDIAS